jgi:hypothetical protein
MDHQAASNGNLQREIRDLHLRMEQVLHTAQKRRKVMGVVLLVITLLILFYFWFIYTQIATIDANLIVNVAEGRIQQMIDDGGDDLTQMLLDNRDEWFDMAEEKAMAAPALIATRLRLSVQSKLNDAAPDLERQMIDGLSEVIDSLYVKAAEGGNGEMTQAQFQRFLEDVSNEMSRSLDNMISQAHARYREGADPVLEGLAALADGEGLTTREMHYREMITDLLAVLEKFQMEARQRQLDSGEDSMTATSTSDAKL